MYAFLPSAIIYIFVLFLGVYVFSNIFPLKHKSEIPYDVEHPLDNVIFLPQLAPAKISVGIIFLSLFTGCTGIETIIDWDFEDSINYVGIAMVCISVVMFYYGIKLFKRRKKIIQLIIEKNNFQHLDIRGYRTYWSGFSNTYGVKGSTPLPFSIISTKKFITRYFKDVEKFEVANINSNHRILVKTRFPENSFYLPVQLDNSNQYEELSSELNKHIIND